MISRSSLILLPMLLMRVSCIAQGTFQIAFDGYPYQAPGTSHAVTNYTESGMSFQPMPGAFALGRVGSDDGSGFPRSGLPDDGSTFLDAALGGSVMLRFVNDTLFNLVSVDLAEYSIAFQTSATIHLVGYRQDGSTVTTVFTTDGIIDGTGPLPDFQTFYFNQDWSGLTRVEIPTSGWSLDNLVVSVPEPSIGALLALGALAFSFWRSKRRKA
jgi:hypothetical protein